MQYMRIDKDCSKKNTNLASWPEHISAAGTSGFFTIPNYQSPRRISKKYANLQKFLDFTKIP